MKILIISLVKSKNRNNFITPHNSKVYRGLRNEFIFILRNSWHKFRRLVTSCEHLLVCAKPHYLSARSHYIKVLLPGDTVVVAGFGGSVCAFPKEDIPNPSADCTFTQPVIINTINRLHKFFNPILYCQKIFWLFWMTSIVLKSTSNCLDYFEVNE